MFIHKAGRYRTRKSDLLSVLIGICLPALFGVYPASADKAGCEYKPIDVARFGQ